MTTPTTAPGWWALARVRWTAGDMTNAPEDIHAWLDLSREGRDRIERRIKKGLKDPDPRVRELVGKITEDIVLATMDTVPASDHLTLEIAAVHARGHRLEPGEPVPGCACPDCTGIAPDHPARIPAWRRADPEGAAESDRQRRERWENMVHRARAVPLLDIVSWLGCGEPVKRGRELHVRCPLHQDSDPSCRLDPSAGVWFCDPCGQGGDAIDLFMRARRLDFADAVRELAA